MQKDGLVPILIRMTALCHVGRCHLMKLGIWGQVLQSRVLGQTLHAILRDGVQRRLLAS